MSCVGNMRVSPTHAWSGVQQEEMPETDFSFCSLELGVCCFWLCCDDQLVPQAAFQVT